MSKQYELSKLNYAVIYHYTSEEETISNLEMATIKTRSNFYQITDVTSNSPKCTCFDMKTMNLPCRHIFRVRNDLKLTLFEPAMVKSSCLNVLPESMSEEKANTDRNNIRRISDLNQHKISTRLTVKEKYNLVWQPIKELANELATLTDEKFHEKFSLLLKIKVFFEKKIDFDAIIIDESSDSDDLDPETLVDEVVHCFTVPNIDLNCVSNKLNSDGYPISVENNDLDRSSNELNSDEFPINVENTDLNSGNNELNSDGYPISVEVTDFDSVSNVLNSANDPKNVENTNSAIVLTDLTLAKAKSIGAKKKKSKRLSHKIEIMNLRSRVTKVNSKKSVDSVDLSESINKSLRKSTGKSILLNSKTSSSNAANKSPIKRGRKPKANKNSMSLAIDLTQAMRTRRKKT